MEKCCKPCHFRWIRLAAGLLVSVTMIANMAQAQGVAQGVTPMAVQPLHGAQWKTLDDLKKAFPNAKFRQVRPEELEKVQRQYELAGRTVLPLPLVQTAGKAGQNIKCVEGKTDREVACPPKGKQEGQEATPPMYAPEIVEPSLNLSFGFSSTIDSRNDIGGELIFLFIIIGIFIVAFVVVASATIAYERIVEGKNYPGFVSLDFGYSFFNFEEDTGNGPQAVEGGALVALRGDFGATKPGRWGVGLSGEIGNMGGVLSVAGGGTYPLTGVYGLVGPVLQLAKGFFQAELLAGTNTQPEVGLMSVARVRFRLPLSLFFGGYAFEGGPYLSGSYGTVFINLKENLGVVQDKGKFNQLWGLNFGYAF